MDDEIPVHGDSHASSSHEASSEPIFKRSEDLGTHFPKDRNCEICKKDPNYKGPMQKTRTGQLVGDRSGRPGEHRSTD